MTLNSLHGQATKYFALSSDAVQGVYSQREPTRQIQLLVIDINGSSMPAEHPLRELYPALCEVILAAPSFNGPHVIQSQAAV